MVFVNYQEKIRLLNRNITIIDLLSKMCDLCYLEKLKCKSNDAVRLVKFMNNKICVKQA